MRIDKFLANNTIYSRKQIHDFIRKNRISVNNIIIKDISLKIDGNNDIVKIDDNKIIGIDNIYIVLNKPKGYVCSNSFNEKYPSILELLPIEFDKYKLHIIGRLDVDTTGLILITNDGKFTHWIKSPKSNIEKRYFVTLDKTINDFEIKKLLNKQIVINSKKIKPFKILNYKDNCVYISLTEGKFHEIKVIFSYINYKVIDLKRIEIGNLNINNINLQEGEYMIIDKTMVINC